MRGFLGLTGYYRKFVKNYGVIRKPLTELLKKNSFKWNEAAKEAKHSRWPCVLLLFWHCPIFNQKPFTLETDACDTGMGAVLMQNQQPVAYFSKAMEVKYQSLSTYDKELMALVWWQQFRNGDITSKMKGRFIIKTMRA